MEFAVSDEFFDGQTLRAASASLFGGADVLECIAIARRVQKDDLDSWYSEWNTAAQRSFDIAVAAVSEGRVETARVGFLKACTYFRTAGLVFLSTPVDPRLPETIARQRDAFRRALPYLRANARPISIPWGEISLPGYHFRAADDARRRATLILLDGYDGTVEETYFLNAQAALDRGYDVLAFDGPGQGSVLVEQGVPMRADWENILPTVVDWLLEQGTADPRRIGLVGASFGGFLAPRAASGEPRIAACVADANFYDLFDMAKSRMPAPIRDQLPDGNRVAVEAAEVMLTEMAKRPTQGWSLRRGLYVHGAKSQMDHLRALEDYTLKGYAERITCPTLICRGESDPISATAIHTYEALTCPKEFIEFSEADGAGDHCELGARQIYHARVFAWLDRILEPAATL